MGRTKVFSSRGRSASFLTAVGAAALAAAPVHAAGAKPSGRRADRGDAHARDAQAVRRTDRVRVGALVGVGFPRPLSVEAFGRLNGFVGVGLEYGFMPEISVANIDVGFRAIAADVRVFPFRSAFFIGLRGGRQWLDAKARIVVRPYGSFRESMFADVWFVNPRVGFLHTFPSGITVGVDAGIQLPIDPRYERRGALTDAGLTSGVEIEEQLSRAAGALGNDVTPTVDLLRLGFLF